MVCYDSRVECHRYEIMFPSSSTPAIGSPYKQTNFMIRVTGGYRSLTTTGLKQDEIMLELTTISRWWFFWVELWFFCCCQPVVTPVAQKKGSSLKPQIFRSIFYKMESLSWGGGLPPFEPKIPWWSSPWNWKTEKMFDHQVTLTYSSRRKSIISHQFIYVNMINWLFNEPRQTISQPNCQPKTCFKNTLGKPRLHKWSYEI